MIRKTFISTLMVCSFFAAYSQQDLIEEIKKMTLTNESLQKEIITLKDSIIKNSDRSQHLNSQITKLEKDLSAANSKVSDLSKIKIKIEKDILQEQVEQLNADIAELKKEILEKDRQISTEIENGNRKAREEKENGKKEILENIALNYKNKPFDDLIKSTTQLSIRRDMQLVGHNPEIKPILSDLLTYFNAEELLKKKFAAAQIEKARTELNQIQQKSDGLLEKLKNALENYQTFNDGFKEMTEKIVALDNKTLVDAMPENIRKQKFYDILSEISSYIFNYDFNLSEYPYLSDIMLEILNRKQPNPDANISYLLNNI